jgi:hypothetical protein
VTIEPAAATDNAVRHAIAKGFYIRDQVVGRHQQQNSSRIVFDRKPLLSG